MSLSVGLVGWATHTGLGMVNRDLVACCPWIEKWYVPTHPLHGFDPSLCLRNLRAPSESWPAVSLAREPQPAQIGDFLDGLDAIMFVECPYVHEILAEAIFRGIKIVFVPMAEWLAKASWLNKVDLIWCVNRWTRPTILDEHEHELRKGVRIEGGAWGIDLRRITYRHSEFIERFLFIHGTGGIAGRKGLKIVAAAAAKVDPIPIAIVTQTTAIHNLAPNCTVIGDVGTSDEIYSHGDCLLLPSLWEGLGVPLFESNAAGLATIVTDAAPMNSLRPTARIKVAREIDLDQGGLRVTGHVADWRHLANLIQFYDSTVQSEALTRGRRSFIEAEHNLELIQVYLRQAIEKLF